MSLFKPLFFTLLLSIISICSWAEESENSVSRFFVAMPDEEIEYLNMSLKNEMVELYKIGTSAKTRNLLGGESWISYIDSTRINITLAEGKCFMTVKQYDQKCGTKIYALVKTMYTPIADNDICFYNERMEKLNSDKIFELPKFKDFFAKTNDKRLCEVMDKIPAIFLKVEVSDNGDFWVSLNDMWFDVLDRDISDMLLQIKKKNPLCYKWTGKRFKVSEN